MKDFKKSFLFNFGKKISVIIKKIFSKKTLSFLFLVCCVLFLCLSPSYIFNKSNYEISLNEILNLTEKESVVLNLWHIETFEGGTNSRKKYLENQAVKFNKVNNNCFISVKTLTEEQLFLNLQENNGADMYSFAIGSGYMLSGKLQELEKNKNIREDLQEYAKLGNKVYAYPYMLSGYALISFQNLVEENGSIENLLKNKIVNKKEVKGVGFSKTSILNPSKILTTNGITNLGENNYFECSTTYNAYTNFLSGKFVTLVGTARDVARIKNREENGQIKPCVYNFLSGFSDLIQCVGISKNIGRVKEDYASKFAQFLTSSSCQSALTNYGLFSVTENKIYSEGFMSNFEQALINPILSQNVFSNLEEIEKEKTLSFNKLFN